MKNIPCQSYRIFNLENTTNYSIPRNLIAIPRKLTLKYISFYKYWARPLKLCSYVLGIKTKKLTQQIFDLGPRSENVEF